MMSLYDVANCTLQYEDSKPQKVWDEFMELIERTEDPELFNNCICRYIIEDSTLPERKIKAKSLIIPLEPANRK